MSNEKKKKTSNNDLVSLIQRYKGTSVVNEIEKNLSNTKRSEYELSSLYLSEFYDEKNYYLESYPSLKESIIKDGFLIPLIIIKGKENKYEIINGAKRYLFAKELKMKTVPCILTELDSERKIAYIIENIMEEDATPLTKTHCFKLLKEQGFTIQDIAEVSSLSESQVRNLIRLDNLSELLKTALIQNKISYGTARALLNLPEKTQKKKKKKIMEEDLSVREIEARKRSFLGKKKKRTISLKGKTVLIKFETEEEAMYQYLKFRKEIEG